MSPRQQRFRCACGATWWWTPGSWIHPNDHTKPNGRACKRSTPTKVPMHTSNDFSAPSPRYTVYLSNENVVFAGMEHLPGDSPRIVKLRPAKELGSLAPGEATREVRAAFLRFLILGGDARHRPHEKGVRVSGGWISGVLDLEGCRIPRDIGLKDCRFDAVPVLRYAVVDNLFLDGSLLPGLQAERLESRGGVSLKSAEVMGEIRLTGSRLDGSLSLRQIDDYQASANDAPSS